MSAKSIVQLALLVLVLAGCKKDSPVEEQEREREFVPGDLLIGIKSGAPIRDIFDLMNENGVAIHRMSGFFYYSMLPGDSLNYVIRELQNQDYFSEGKASEKSVYVHAIENRIRVIGSFAEMPYPAQQDWLKTIDDLELKDLDNDTRYVYIKVEPGTEKAWLGRFTDHPYVKWVELNWYSDIVLF